VSFDICNAPYSLDFAVSLTTYCRVRYVELVQRVNERCWQSAHETLKEKVRAKATIKCTWQPCVEKEGAEMSPSSTALA
jgi:hypothetical protein